MEVFFHFEHICPNDPVSKVLNCIYNLPAVGDYSKLDLLSFPGVVKGDFGIVNKNY